MEDLQNPDILDTAARNVCTSHFYQLEVLGLLLQHSLQKRGPWRRRHPGGTEVLVCDASIFKRTGISVGKDHG